MDIYYYSLWIARPCIPDSLPLGVNCMNIIEKFDIGILNYGRIEPDNLDGDLCMISESDLDNFTEQFKELLKALIEAVKEEIENIEEMGGCDHSVGICWCDLKSQIEQHKEIIEKVTDESWEEINELYK